MELKNFLILNIPTCFLQVLFINLQLKSKLNKYFTFLLFYVPFLLLATMKVTKPEINSAISESLTFIYSFAATVFFYKGKFKTKFYLFMMDYIIFFSVDFACLAVYSMLGGDLLNPDIVFSIVNNLALAFAVFLFVFARKKTLFGIENNRFIIFGVSLIVVSHIAFSLCIDALYSSKIIISDKAILGVPVNSQHFYILVFFVMGIILFSTDLLMIFVMNRASKSVAMQKDLELYEYKQSLYADYYAEVEANSRQTRVIRHDMANIAEAIGAMLQSDNSVDKAVANELYEKLQADIQSIRSYVYCSDNLLNAILTIKANICRKKGIEPDFAVSANDFSKLDKTDLCKTVTNLLDNAIKSTAEANEEKKIVFRIAADDNSLFISTVNPIGVNQPTPDDEKTHGYGLKILEDVAKKNKGEFITEEKDGMFTAQMII